MNNKYIEIGKVVNTFGLKGELKIQSESDFIDYRFGVGHKIYLKRGRIIEEYQVSSMRMLKGNVIICVNELDDINLVEHLIGSIVLALKDDLPPLNEDEYLIDDLVGLEVVDENQAVVGIVNDVIIIPSNDILEIKMMNGTLKLIPFVDEFVLEVTDTKLIVKMPEEDL